MRRTLLSLAIVVFLAPVAFARSGQTDLSGEPGYLDIGRFKAFSEGQSVVEISLTQPLLSIARWAVAEDDPDLAEMLGGLKLLQVNVFSFPMEKEAGLSSSIEKIGQDIQNSGWTSIVKVRDKGELWNILVKMDETGGKKGAPMLNGVALVGFGDKDSEIHYRDEDGLEAVFVNIVGRLDFGQLSKLGKHFDIPQLEDVGGDSSKGKGGAKH